MRRGVWKNVPGTTQDKTSQWLMVISAQLRLALLVQSTLSAEGYGIVSPATRNQEIKELNQWIEQNRNALE